MNANLSGWLQSRTGAVVAAGLAIVLLASTLAVALPGADTPTAPPSSDPTSRPGLSAGSGVTPSPADSPSATSDATPTTDPTDQASAQPGTSSPQPTPLSPYAPLDGMPADPELAHRLPLAVMIDNNGRARPQAGFNRASIVYQAPNDGGTDRYMLIFQEQDAKLIGPVRSTRPFFVSWVAEYRAAHAHFGGDWKAVKRVRELDGKKLFDVDALDGSGGAYWRESSRRAPFNAYSSSERLWNEAARQGAPAQIVAGLGTRPFADDLPAGERPGRGSISIPYRHGAVSYKYDHEANSYLRFVAGEPHRDAHDDSRVTARNVIVQFVNVYYDPKQRYNRAVMEEVGKGRAIVFRDGLAIEGTWRKDGEAGLTRFFDKAGKEVSLVRGRIFIQVVPDSTRVSYEVGPR